MSEGWTMAENDVRSGVWPRQPRLDLWYLARHDATQEPFTELDLIYGNAGVRDGWERVGVVTNTTGKTAVSLIGRRKPKRALPLSVLHLFCHLTKKQLYLQSPTCASRQTAAFGYCSSPTFTSPPRKVSVETRTIEPPVHQIEMPTNLPCYSSTERSTKRSPTSSCFRATSALPLPPTQLFLMSYAQDKWSRLVMERLLSYTQGRPHLRESSDTMGRHLWQPRWRGHRCD